MTGTEIASAVDDLEEEDIKNFEEMYLIFSLEDRFYGIEIQYITEIIGMQPITIVPDVPSFIMGVINLRGKVVPVIDMRRRFEMKSLQYGNRTCIIIVTVFGEQVGFIVDTVREVVRIPSENCEDPPKLSGEEFMRFIRHLGKVGDEVRMLLHIEEVVKIKI